MLTKYFTLTLKAVLVKQFAGFTTKIFKITRKRNCTAPLFLLSHVDDGFEVGYFQFLAAFCLSDTCNSLGAHWNGIGVLCD